MPQESTRERMISASFALFTERGFEATTVDDIAQRAGVSRMTFFRAFGSKEGVIFPDHDRLLSSIADRFESSRPESAELAIVEAARLVLQHYLEEGDLARARYGLTRTVPALRDREIAGVRQYEKLFRDFISRSWGEQAPSLEAELLAGAVVTAHNVVLRNWLRGQVKDPLESFEDAMRVVLARFRKDPSAAPPSQVLILRTRRELDDVLPQLQELLD